MLCFSLQYSHSFIDGHVRVDEERRRPVQRDHFGGHWLRVHYSVPCGEDHLSEVWCMINISSHCLPVFFYLILPFIFISFHLIQHHQAPVCVLWKNYYYLAWKIQVTCLFFFLSSGLVIVRCSWVVWPSYLSASSSCYPGETSIQKFSGQVKNLAEAPPTHHNHSILYISEKLLSCKLKSCEIIWTVLLRLKSQRFLAFLDLTHYILPLFPFLYSSSSSLPFFCSFFFSFLPFFLFSSLSSAFPFLSSPHLPFLLSFPFIPCSLPHLPFLLSSFSLFSSIPLFLSFLLLFFPSLPHLNFLLSFLSLFSFRPSFLFPSFPFNFLSFLLFLTQ